MSASKIAAAAGLCALIALAAPSLAWSQDPLTTASPARLQLARDLIQAQGGATTLLSSMKGSEQAMAQAIMQSSAVTPQMRDALIDGMDKAAAELVPHLIDQVATIYAEDFNEAQLTDILAFYRTPTGRALVARLPDIARQSSQTVAQYMPQIQYAMLKSICATTPCPPTVLQRMDAMKATLPKE